MIGALHLLGQYDTGTSTSMSGGSAVVVILFCLAFAVLVLASLWKIFTKAGQPGWAAIIPIYNYYVMLKIIGRPGWWLILYFIPLVNIIIALIVVFDLAKSFGKGVGFGFGLLFLSIIFYPILAFGDAQYVGPAGAST